MASSARASEGAQQHRQPSHDSQSAEQNRLLWALPAETYERLWPDLEPIEL